MEKEEAKVIVVSEDDFPQQIKKVRQEKELTQKELAEKADVTQQTISAIENGRLDPSLKLLMLLAGILGVSLLISVFSKKGGEK